MYVYVCVSKGFRSEHPFYSAESHGGGFSYLSIPEVSYCHNYIH